MTAPTAGGYQGRAAARSIVRSRANIIHAALAATAARTSSSHCMPVPSGALKGTARPRPTSPRASVQRIWAGSARSQAHDGVAAGRAGDRPAPRAPGAGDELLGLERPGEHVALQVAVPHVAEQLEHGRVGDALDDDRQAQAGAQVQHRAAHGAAGRVVLDVGQEVLVHLEHVDGHADEVGQRRPAGAEVVDGDADAELAEDGEVLDDVGVVEQDRLGDLDDQPGRGQAAVLQRGDDVGDELAAADLAGGDVDRDARARCRRGRRWSRTPRAAPSGRCR